MSWRGSYRAGFETGAAQSRGIGELARRARRLQEGREDSADGTAVHRDRMLSANVRYTGHTLRQAPQRMQLSTS